ncbi:hypothetical protein CBM2587_B90756 [Cupriavidus taiwanensis]|uniref:Uncharacterized protein n=1 Tax=Cupriavidus taiwanensis TaxID=164546 RepID=A0A375CE50_9BURK|nr:hypothetical protein CBM2587_B90756 [Cupriavidus taiwanensis]
MDNRLAARLSTGLGPVPARRHARQAGISQNRVRQAACGLWKSLWVAQVIPAESGSRRPQIRVRVVADTGSPLR